MVGIYTSLATPLVDSDFLRLAEQARAFRGLPIWRRRAPQRSALSPHA